MIFEKAKSISSKISPDSEESKPKVQVIPRLAQKCEFGPTRKLSRFNCFSEGSIEYIQPSEKQLNPEALARSKFTFLGESWYRY